MQVQRFGAPPPNLNSTPHMANLSLPLCNKEVKHFAWINTPGSQGLPVHAAQGIRQTEGWLGQMMEQGALLQPLPFCLALRERLLCVLLCPVLRLLCLHTLSPLQ